MPKPKPSDELEDMEVILSRLDTLLFEARRLASEAKAQNERIVQKFDVMSNELVALRGREKKR